MTKEVTNEELARMIAEGFAGTSTKEDFQTLRTDIGKIDERLRTVETKLDRALYTEITHLESRVTRLEEHAGFVK